jgi:hypothetical protein
MCPAPLYAFRELGIGFPAIAHDNARELPGFSCDGFPFVHAPAQRGISMILYGFSGPISLEVDQIM